jgi:hypothetical protein
VTACTCPWQASAVRKVRASVPVEMHLVRR